MCMRRRTLLAAAAAGLTGSGGCATLSDGGPRETATNRPETTADLPTFAEDEVQRKISIASVDSVPAENLPA